MGPDYYGYIAKIWNRSGNAYKSYKIFNISSKYIFRRDRKSV